MRAPWFLGAVLTSLPLSSCAPEAVASGSDAPLARSQTLRAEVSESEQVESRCDDRALELADDGGPDRAMMKVRHDGHAAGLPLQSAAYESFVVGTVVETTVEQRFFNPLDRTIEAVYVFPLPHTGAVHDYTIRLQDRVIEGQMRRRHEARELYAQAQREGRTAGLLEQERPNIFTQHIANIPPGEHIEVEMRVVHPLAREDGRYVLVLPTVVGPRYASRITPAVLPESVPPCANLSISVAIESGMAVHDVRSKHHDVELHSAGSSAEVELTSGSAIANRDFELSFRVAGAQPQAALSVQPEAASDGEQEGGFFSLTLEPPASLPHARAVPRELVFVVDNSGSMHGEPIAAAKDAMRKVLRQLGPDDVFQVIEFSSRASALGPDFLPNTEAAVRRGLDFVDAMSGMGGTDMLLGIRAALSLPRDRSRLRMVLFLTDGYIGNENEIFSAVRKQIGDGRLFSLGVGTSVNRYLLDGLARIGHGDVSYVSPGEATDAVVKRFFERIDRPALTDVEIDWGGLDVLDLEPKRIPDLFACNSVVVFGRYLGKPRGDIVLRARSGTRRQQMRVAVDFERPAHSSAALGAMWARARIDSLSDAVIGHVDEPTRREDEIVKLALAHRVMTPYTAFIAVDRSRVVPPGSQTLHVPVAMPSGVDYEHVFGHGYGGGAGAFHGRDAAVARVRMGKLRTRGELSKELIRRIVARHVNEVRFCYEQELSASPTLAGQLAVKFVIAPSGAVQTAAMQNSNLQNTRLEQCVLAAVRRWTFPAPSGSGSVVVTSPFLLGT